MANCYNNYWLHACAVSGQPANCIQNFRITENLTDIIIIPGIVNCFSCELDSSSNVTWQVSSGGHLVPASLSPDVEAIGEFLIITMPESYVQPGTSGEQTIVCTSLNEVGQDLVARLLSPGMPNSDH